ncbi:MAG: peptide deformylase [Paracoccaceae bacterium]
MSADLAQVAPDALRPVRWPHPALRARAAEVARITGEIRSIWDRMVEVMEAMPGVGLAAPQLGLPLRLAVVDASDARGRAIRMANPVILHASATLRSHEEASPNLPGVSAGIERPRAVTVRFTDERGEDMERDLVGLWATSVQHQIDHLDGRMFFDRLSRLKRDRLLARARKLSR